MIVYVLTKEKVNKITRISSTNIIGVYETKELAYKVFEFIKLNEYLLEDINKYFFIYKIIKKELKIDNN